ncbi:MAG TPA: tetratricopeptide repeat protein [Vicinamibacterales bacterium]|nr:tetratricopeptide repeat protein [Vicinamibacterales bacterium]
MRTARPAPVSGRVAGWLAIALAALTIATYAGVWSYGFVNFDDPQYVVNNPHVTGGLSWTNVVWAFTSGYAANWHPVTWVSHMIDVTLFGPSAGPAHAVNLAIHVVNVLLLFAFLARTTGAMGRSAVVAALFAVHPLHVESVAWISERKDVLSTFFGLCTLLLYVGYVRRPGFGRALAMCGMFVLGLMAKPMLVTLPLVMLVLDRWPLGRPATLALVREKIPLFALSAAAIVVTVVAQRQAGAVAALDPYPLTARIAHVTVAFIDYALQMVWPSHLSVFYPLPLATPVWRIAISTIVLGLLTLTAIRPSQPRPYVLTGWLWYVFMLVPVIGLVQVGGQGMADRYTYLPLVGLFVIVVWSAPDVFAGSRWARVALPAAAVMAVAAYAFVAHRQLQVWRDSMSLWTHALEVTTGNYRAENAVGALFVEQGRVDDAVPHLAEAIRIEPAYAEAHSNLGAALARRGQIDDAIVQYREALRLSPDLAQAHNNLGLALARTGDVDGAIREIREAVRLSPDRQDFRYNLSVLLRQ